MNFTNATPTYLMFKAAKDKVCIEPTVVYNLLQKTVFVFAIRWWLVPCNTKSLLVVLQGLCKTGTLRFVVSESGYERKSFTGELGDIP